MLMVTKGFELQAVAGQEFEMAHFRQKTVNAD